MFLRVSGVNDTPSVNDTASNQKDMNRIFVLDIGTRKVCGLIAEPGLSNCLEVIDCEILEHETRAMYAGQIHDIDKVAKTVGIIKETLEKKNNLKLEKVAVAVAGRMLRTFSERKNRVISLDESQRNIPRDEEISVDEIRDLELMAVQEIINRLGKQSMEFYCVGYTVVNYYLDNQRINNLIGQKGTEIGVEVLATFLPRKVLESIFTVLRKVGLEAFSVSLEPIAAINAIIPADMRRLNLALVDIGAGTSDIAITRGGSIIAYGMVPLAGDEITEKICERYLLDFNTGEQVKRNLSIQEKISFTDIFEQKHELTTEEIITEIIPAVENLAKKITQEIITLNQNPVTAVVCVGGGSLTPLLQEKLASSLNLDKRRVGIRKTEMIQSLLDKTGRLYGPEGVTPVGIALLAWQNQGLEFMNVKVNEKRVHLVNLNRNLTVVSALAQAGVEMKKIYSRPGLAKTFEINGQLKIVKGTIGKNAVIKLNGEDTKLDTLVSNDDEITFIEAIDGEDAKVKIIGVINEEQIKRVVLNGKETRIMPNIFIDSKILDLETEIPDRAKIVIKPDYTIRSLLEKEGYKVENNSTWEICVFVNEQTKILKQRTYQLLVNGVEAGFDYEINDGDIIEYQTFPRISYRVKDVIDLPVEGKSLRVKVNGEEYVFPGGKGKILLNDREVRPEEYIYDGAEIKTYPGKDAEVILADIFRYVSLDLENKQMSSFGIGSSTCRKLRLLINNCEAKFTTPLSDGSEVKIYFE